MVDPGTTVTTALNAEQQGALLDLEADLADVESITADGLRERYPAPTSAVGYDPTQAEFMDLIQASSLALSASEQTTLAEKGFVISRWEQFPTFTNGYERIYADDLPVYVSADSIIHAVHRSYDEILKLIEVASLIPSLRSMLRSMRGALPSAAVPDTARADADFYLTVAAGLLDGEVVAPTAGASADEVTSFVQAAEAASGMEEVELFGVHRWVDFSQMTPRGHYRDTPELEQYFRTMMWLGRIDFRLLEAQPVGTQVFHRRQLEGTLALRELMTEAARSEWATLFDTIGAFVGEPDSMTLPELDDLMADLGISTAAGLEDLSDERIAQAIMDGGYGTQRIASHAMVNDGDLTLPLSSTFLLLGQRYVVDSHVFSNVVFDRVPARGELRRMLPDPLDVAFAALGNNHALPLLQQELATYGYAPQLGATRILVDAHPEDYWNGNLYNLWVGALRGLSPSDDGAGSLPSVARTEPWGRRILSSQLASWAELRHDTLLYVKQSYTNMFSCEYPDAYVDPYPQFYERVAALGARGQEVGAALALPAGSTLQTRIVDYFGRVQRVAATLQEMAEHQLTGTPHSQEHVDFINRVVAVEEEFLCGATIYHLQGWYTDLFFSPDSAMEYDPTIADVHTSPMEGEVLHVGTGRPRRMVVTIDTCVGPRAYVGLASAYYEHVTTGFQRLNDEEWSGLLDSNSPSDVPWMQDLVVR
jgi:hypothetical protein